MQENYINCYKSARQYAGFTQERWAELIGVSTESVRLYESGKSLPSDEVVTRMVEMSMLPALAYKHLMLKSSIAADILPEVPDMPLPQAVIKLICCMRDFEEKHRDQDLMHIAMDGRVDAKEEGLFEEIVDELENVIQAAMTVKFAKEGRHENIGRN